MTSSSASSPTAHISTVRRNGFVDGHQLRWDGGGPGKTMYFSARKAGGERESLRAARRAAADKGLTLAKSRGGSRVGRLISRNKSGAPGLQFVWTEGVSGPILRVAASWTQPSSRGLGTPRHTSYSVEHNGLAGALDLAIEARVSCGAPRPDRAMLLERLQNEYRTRRPAP